MDILVWTYQKSEIYEWLYQISDKSISDFRYIHSEKMDISEMGILEMEISVRKFPFPISLFPIYTFYSYGYIGMDISVCS
jgi:hypothetical protein